MSESLNEATRRFIEEEGLEECNRFYSFYPGIVRKTVDELGLGRVTVEVPMVSSRVLPNPAMPLGAVFGPAFEGVSLVPDVGSPVIVWFQGGDVNRPYYMAGSPTVASRASTPTASPQKRSIESKLVRVEVDDVAGTIRFAFKSGVPAFQMSVANLAYLAANIINLGSETLLPTAGVVTGECLCPFTTVVHADVSSVVRARKV